MDAVAAFAAAYGTAIVLAAIGIDRVGVISARRRPGGQRDAAIPWPHLGSITLHRVVATVAAAAALLLALVFAALHHTGPDIAALAVPVILAVITLRRLAARLHQPR